MELFGRKERKKKEGGRVRRKSKEELRETLILPCPAVQGELRGWLLAVLLSDRSLRDATCFSSSNLCGSRSGPRILVAPPLQAGADWCREAGTAGGLHVSWAAPELPSHGDDPAGFEPHCHSEAPFHSQLGSLLLNHKSTYIYFHFFLLFRIHAHVLKKIVIWKD